MSAELTEAEREVLEVSTALFGWATQAEALEATKKAVESILTARLAAVEAERDEAVEFKESYHTQWMLTARDCESAEQQLADLRASITALAEQWKREDDMSQWGSHQKYSCARKLDALLADQHAPIAGEPS